jgi:type II secretory pathway component PulF
MSAGLPSLHRDPAHAEPRHDVGSSLRWLDELVGDLQPSLVYPLGLTVATFGLMVGLFTFFVPRFVVLLQRLALQPPLLTRMLLGASAGLVRGWPVLLTAALGLWAALETLRGIGPLAGASDRARLKLLFGLVLPPILVLLTGLLGAVLLGAALPLLQLWQAR